MRLILAALAIFESATARTARLSREHAARKIAATRSAPMQRLAIASPDSKDRAPYPYH